MTNLLLSPYFSNFTRKDDSFLQHQCVGSAAPNRPRGQRLSVPAEQAGRTPPGASLSPPRVPRVQTGDAGLEPSSALALAPPSQAPRSPSALFYSAPAPTDAAEQGGRGGAVLWSLCPGAPLRQLRPAGVRTPSLGSGLGYPRLSVPTSRMLEVRVHPGGLGALADSHPPDACFSRRRRASTGAHAGPPEGPAGSILQAPALPVVAPAAVGQGPVAADSLHRRLRAPRAAAEAARGWELARCGPGAGGGLYHSRGGGTPLRLCQWLGRAGCGDPGPRGPLPRAASRGGAAAASSTTYLFPMCAPRRHGNRSIFSRVIRAPRFQTFPGQGLLRGCPFS